MIKTYIIVALVSYLLGSIPFGYILVKLFLKQDIRQTGSGNIGATNVARSGAKGLAIATLVLDAAKGYGAIIASAAIGLAMGMRPDINQDCWGCETFFHLYMFSAFFAVAGHMFPVWLKFQGGKGVATALGALALIDPLALSMCVVVFAIVAVLSRYVSLASIVAAVCFPIMMLTFGLSKQASIRDVWPVVAISFLIVLKHHENIRRLIAGTENKFGGKKSVPPPEAMEKQA